MVGWALALAFWIGSFRDRRRAEEVTSKAFAAQRAAEIWIGDDGVGVATGRATPWGHLSGSHTTHLSMADADGMMVALTQTLGPNMGSKVVTPGLGFLYASTWEGTWETCSPVSGPVPSSVPSWYPEDGRPLMVLGAAGGAMIPVAVVNAIVHYRGWRPVLSLRPWQLPIGSGSRGRFHHGNPYGAGWATPSWWKPSVGWGWQIGRCPGRVASVESTESPRR